MKMVKLGILGVGFISSALMMQTIAYAGSGSHGGIGMGCKDANGELSSVELLDLVEGRELNGNIINVTNAPVDEQISAALAKISDEYVREYLIKEVKRIKDSARILDAKYILVPTEDYSTPIIPRNCDLVQIASYYGKNNKVLLNQELFNRLSNTDKAALFVHEAAYKLFRDAVNATSSDDVRLLVGDLFAEGDQSAEIAQIVALVHKFVVLDESNLSFVSIPAGTFQMGSLVGEFGHNYFEALHTVTISRSFEMQATTVTQFQWFVEMGGNPSSFKDRKYCPEDYVEVRGTALCPNNPVENISWNDAQGFIQKLNARGDGYTYRLPTEAEWEYAARAKTQTSYYFGNNANVVGDYAWVGDNAGNQTHAVATKLPNNFGLYDMYGNVWQWVQDLDDAYPAGSVTDPSGPLSGTQRVLRGSGWSCYDARAFRSASRLASDPSHRGRNLGFRLVRTAAPQS